MRLTLRTLLAFLNDAGLKSPDRKEIRSRIKQSENARKLMEHLKVITSDPGIEVFEPGDQDGFRNPNLVAQYLDSSISEKEVEPFEKEALASAPLLSEIANCHAILSSLFRNDAIQVPLGIRQKIYSLSPVRGDLESMEEGEFVDEHQVRVPTIKPDLPMSDNDSDAVATEKGSKRVGETHRSQNDSGQDFECGEPQANKDRTTEKFKTKSPQTRWSFLAVAALILLTLGIGLGWIIGNGGLPFGEEDLGPLSDIEKKALLDKEKNGSDTDADKDVKKSGDKKGQPSSNGKDDLKKSETGDSGKQNAKAGDGGGDPTKSDNSSKSDGADKTKQTKTVPGENPDGKKDAKQVTDDKGKGKQPIAKKQKEPVEQQPVVAGSLTETQLAVRLDPGTNRWLPFQDEAEIHESILIKTFHGFPTKIKINQLGNLEVRGKSSFQFGPSKDKIVQLQVDHGLFSIVADESKFELATAGRKLHVELTRPGTQFWIHVRRFSPNRDLANLKDRATLVQMFVAKGKAKVTAGTKVNELTVAGGLEFVDDQPIKSGTLENRRPVWINPDKDWVIESSVDKILEKIKRDEPIEQQLTEMTDDIRFEVATVATQMLSSLGYYQPLIQLLDNENNRTVWSKTYQQFQDDLATNPKLVRRLTESLGEAKDPEQKVLFSMLVGTNNKQLEAGLDRQLVEQLESKSLARRVLAIENLSRITSRTYLFRPDSLERFRKIKVRQWNRDMEKKRIRFSSAVELPQFEFSSINTGKPIPGKEESKKKAEAPQPDQSGAEKTNGKTKSDSKQKPDRGADNAGSKKDGGAKKDGGSKLDLGRKQKKK